MGIILSLPPTIRNTYLGEKGSKSVTADSYSTVPDHLRVYISDHDNFFIGYATKQGYRKAAVWVIPQEQFSFQGKGMVSFSLHVRLFVSIDDIAQRQSISHSCDAVVNTLYPAQVSYVTDEGRSWQTIRPTSRYSRLLLKGVPKAVAGITFSTLKIDLFFAKK